MKRTASRGNLFLIEIILGILFFSIAAAVCVQLFVKAHTMGAASTDLNRGVALAQTAAETFRACEGSLPETGRLLSAENKGDETIVAYYDAQGTPCGENEAVYVLSIIGSKENYLSSGLISVVREGEEIYNLRTDFAVGE